MIIADSRISYSTYRFQLFALLLAMIGMQQGCLSLIPPAKPNVQLGNSKKHFVKGEPTISISPLLNRKNEVLGAIVQVGSYDAAEKEMQLANSPNPNAASVLRSMLAIDDLGVHLIADNKSTLLDETTLLGGPWIYYLNEAEQFRRIPVKAEQIKEFEASLQNQGPVEFVAQWCDKQQGEPTGGLTQAEWLSKIKSK